MSLFINELEQKMKTCINPYLYETCNDSQVENISKQVVVKSINDIKENMMLKIKVETIPDDPLHDYFNNLKVKKCSSLYKFSALNYIGDCLDNKRILNLPTKNKIIKIINTEIIKWCSENGLSYNIITEDDGFDDINITWQISDLNTIQKNVNITFFDILKQKVIDLIEANHFYRNQNSKNKSLCNCEEAERMIDLFFPDEISNLKNRLIDNIEVIHNNKQTVCETTTYIYTDSHKPGLHNNIQQHVSVGLCNKIEKWCSENGFTTFMDDYSGNKCIEYKMKFILKN